MGRNILRSVNFQKKEILVLLVIAMFLIFHELRPGLVGTEGKKVVPNIKYYEIKYSS